MTSFESILSLKDTAQFDNALQDFEVSNLTIQEINLLLGRLAQDIQADRIEEATSIFEFIEGYDFSSTISQEAIFTVLDSVDSNTKRHIQLYACTCFSESFLYMFSGDSGGTGATRFLVKMLLKSDHSKEVALYILDYVFISISDGSLPEDESLVHRLYEVIEKRCGSFSGKDEVTLRTQLSRYYHMHHDFSDLN